MVSVAYITEKLIEEQPFLQEALSRGLVNNAALAEELRPHIERVLKKPVKFSAVNMAIRRLSEKLGQSFVSTAHFDSSAHCTLQSRLVEIVLYRSRLPPATVSEVYAATRPEDFLTVTQGRWEVMVITNAYNLVLVTKLCKVAMKKVITDLSSLTIHISESASQTVGLFYIASRALNWHNINIVDIVSTYTEMTFIVHADDAGRAYEIVQKLLKDTC